MSEEGEKEEKKVFLFARLPPLANDKACLCPPLCLNDIGSAAAAAAASSRLFRPQLVKKAGRGGEERTLCMNRWALGREGESGKGKGASLQTCFCAECSFRKPLALSLSLPPFNVGQADSQMHNCCYEALSLLLPWVCLTLHPLEA